jgi:putative Mg2+ transporter-C (MgtC) family protein
MLSVTCGFIIGLERERRHRPAGIKTHILVCMGAALVSLIQVYMINEVLTQISLDPNLASVLKSDYGRMGAQVISGIGFLGAGTIMKTKGSIQGLTTASTVWLSACVGLAIGMGYYYISLISLAFTILVLVSLNFIQKAVQKSIGIKKVEVTLLNKKDGMNFINDYCIFRNIIIKNIEYMELSDEKDEDARIQRLFTYEFSLMLPRNITLDNVIMDLQMDDSIVNVSALSVL